jgi:hypothetical protein
MTLTWYKSRHFLFQPVLVQVKFAKYILGVNKTASNLAVLGELGMIPCSVDAIKLSVGFWHHVVNSKGTRFALSLNNVSTQNFTTVK